MPDSAVALAHSLAGNSATVGYLELSTLARALEHALMRSHAGGLGREVWSAIQRLEAGRGFQAGIAIAVLAVILDRVTQAMSRRSRTA